MGSDVGVRLSMHSCLIILVLQTHSDIKRRLCRTVSMYSRLLEMSDYTAKYQNDISVKNKGELLEEDQLHTESKQDFKMVENRIDEIIKGAKGEIAILFCNLDALKRRETESILKFVKERTSSNILIRILFPLGVHDMIFNTFSEVANIRIFETKLENNDIIIVPDYKVLLVSTTDPTGYDKETVYTVTYSNNEEINYTYVTMFEKLWLLQTVTKLDV